MYNLPLITLLYKHGHRHTAQQKHTHTDTHTHVIKHTHDHTCSKTRLHIHVSHVFSGGWVLSLKERTGPCRARVSQVGFCGFIDMVIDTQHNKNTATDTHTHTHTHKHIHTHTHTGYTAHTRSHLLKIHNHMKTRLPRVLWWMGAVVKRRTWPMPTTRFASGF
jgi:hypothetical protein